MNITQEISENNVKINEGLTKSFDNLMLQQEKMDTKAFIFVGFLGAVLGIINKDSFQNIPFTWFLIIAMQPFIISLIPIATKWSINILNKIVKNKINDNHNIFYYIDLYGLTQSDFIKILDLEYDIKNINKIEYKLIEQIIINSKILYLKAFWHNLAFKILVISLLTFGFINLLFVLF